eukprot:jgi/Bigna1/141375/aug1.62_g16083
MVEASIASPEAALAVSEAGADFLHSTFEFRRPGNDEKKSFEEKTIVSFKDEMKRKDTCFVGTMRVEGEGKAAEEFMVPYKSRGVENPLKGDEVKKLADRWAKYGTIEPDAAASLKAVVDHPEWLGKGLKDHYFVLIGAGSAMGPFLKLMELGANVIALDIPGAWEKKGRPSVWRRLMEVARKSAGKIIFPLNKKAKDCKNDDDIVKAAGANLMTQPADLKNWLLNLPEIKNKKNHVVIGNYTYLDGALHVKLSVCADAIMKAVYESRPKNKTTLCFLCTPTDMHVVVVHNLRMFMSLPKRPQKQLNLILTPSSSEVFEQETTNAVMTAALLFDIFSPDSAAKPANRGKKSINNTLELFKYNSFHGGVWRCGYSMDTLGVPSVLIYFLGGPNLFVPLVVALSGALSAAIYNAL